MKKIVSTPKSLICIKTGKGKTLSAIFAAKYLLKHDMVDKVVFAGTKTSINSFVKAFRTQLNTEVKITEKDTEFLDFIKSDKKLLLCKHHMFELIGKNYNHLQEIENELNKTGKRIMCVVDEAHNLSNATGVGSIRSSCGVGHQCFERCRFMFTRITLLTATPYSSCLSQFYGLIHLIYPNLWSTPKKFWDDYIELKELKDWKTGKFLRYEKVAYKNLKKLRELINPFSYFYYPPAKLNFIEHKIRLSDYSRYNELVMGVITDEDMEKAVAKREEKERKKLEKLEKKKVKK